MPVPSMSPLSILCLGLTRRHVFYELEGWPPKIEWYPSTRDCLYDQHDDGTIHSCGRLLWCCIVEAGDAALTERLVSSCHRASGVCILIVRRGVQVGHATGFGGEVVENCSYSGSSVYAHARRVSVVRRVSRL